MGIWQNATKKIWNDIKESSLSNFPSSESYDFVNNNQITKYLQCLLQGFLPKKKDADITNGQII